MSLQADAPPPGYSIAKFENTDDASDCLYGWVRVDDIEQQACPVRSQWRAVALAWLHHYRHTVPNTINASTSPGAVPEKLPS